MAEKPSIHYSDYLQLEKILEAQNPLSFKTDSPSHDEMLFIIVHQTYELWFKQVLFEVQSIIPLFHKNPLKDEELLAIHQRLIRVNQIFKILEEQVSIVETMTPLDFLNFRKLLGTASGFQSIQFRVFENTLGLRPNTRVSLNEAKYYNASNETEEKAIEVSEKNTSLFQAIESWLERLPFICFGDFNFLKSYRSSVDELLRQEKEIIALNLNLTDQGRKRQYEALEESKQNFESLFDPSLHDVYKNEGKKRLSYRATIASLMIMLYRDEPLLQMPFRIINSLMDMDEIITTWRYRHALLAHRMLGSKMGTGGSSGYDYLKSTAERHRVFSDFANLSTFLVPRSSIPSLPEDLKRNLGFYYRGETSS